MGVVLAADIFAGYETLNILWKARDPAYVATNPSILRTDRDGESQWRAIARCINYRLGEPCPMPAYSRSVLLELDPALDGTVVNAHEIADAAGRDRTSYPIHGYEDCRFFHWQGPRVDRDSLWATATCCDLTPHGNREICLLRFDKHADELLDVIPIRGPWSTYYQKNWIPCPVDGELALIYAVDRALAIIINDHLAVEPLALDRGERRNINDIRWRDTGLHRGSSQGLAFQDGWMFIVHEAGYRSRFVITDGTFRPTFMGPFFKFRDKQRVEFCAGLALDGANLVASYSVHDASLELGFFPLESVMTTMRPVKERDLWTP